ncbi:hypothetical protein MLD38_033062 [Melastoma candidum]|uniref:Uncharacterized protein n=1 Tax=Melastoma candidum TaxID=119954 RepID=A0ACB9M5D1_9MYRT|nr:hypothetical protein MLD38_033062 [Melastoma candidum]
MLRGRSRVVAKQTLAADHRSHPQPPPPPHHNPHPHNPPPFYWFLSRFRQFAVRTPETPSFQNRDGGTRHFGGRVRGRSWEADARGISLVVSAGRSKLVLFGAEVGVRTGDPVSADDPAATTHVRFVDNMRRGKSSRRGEGESFLSSCYTCKKMIEPTEDIYIYGGEKAFCSWDCRHTEILRDTALNLDHDDDGQDVM